MFKLKNGFIFIVVLLIVIVISSLGLAGSVKERQELLNFPIPLTEYADSQVVGVFDVLRSRINVEPLNIWVTLIFLLAVLHTFIAPKLLIYSRKLSRQAKILALKEKGGAAGGMAGRMHFRASLLHFLGEIEAVFGIWIVPLLIVVAATKSWATIENYLNHKVHFAEPLFVVVIMTIAATRPILRLTECFLRFIARLGGESVLAWWLTILIVGPLLGSFITEPATMTISAMLLVRHFYRFRPERKLALATVGLLFVNVSVGGTLTHFAAPPILMVASRWGWDTYYVLLNLGIKAIIGIIISSLLYAAIFRKEFARLNEMARVENLNNPHRALDLCPWPITIIHLFFLVWTILNIHSPVLTIGGFLFFLAFAQASSHHQSPISLRSPLLVGFFLGALVIHGGLQAWWIEPILSRLSADELMGGAMLLTAFNDNAAITYLSSLVPGMTDPMKYALVAGAVAGGGLTVIANAPNPAGHSILSPCFKKGGITALGLLVAATIPTAIMMLVFWLFVGVFD